MPDGIWSTVCSGEPGPSPREVCIVPPLNPEVDLASYTAKQVRQRLRLIRYLTEPRPPVDDSANRMMTVEEYVPTSLFLILWTMSYDVSRANHRCTLGNGTSYTKRSRWRGKLRKRRMNARISPICYCKNFEIYLAMCTRAPCEQRSRCA